MAILSDDQKNYKHAEYLLCCALIKYSDHVMNFLLNSNNKFRKLASTFSSYYINVNVHSYSIHR
jgi:hypothetical protein